MRRDRLLRLSLAGGALSVASVRALMDPGPARAQDDLPRCFEQDPGAGLTSRDPHLQWAQSQSVDGLVANINYKLDLLVRCPLGTDELAAAFASVSWWIANRTQEPARFGGDPGVVNPSLQAHRDWAQQRSPDLFMANLKWKSEAALRCLDPVQQRELFADISSAIALAPLQNP